LVIVLIVGAVLIRSRGRRPVTPKPPIFTTPSQP
jgi:hypothetical protein